MSHTVISNATELVISTSEGVSGTLVAVDWIGFIVLFGSSVVIAYKLVMFPGPVEAPEDYFFGYREAKMLPVYVNLFAAIAYWLHISAHANGGEGYVASLDSIKYMDYIFTCPILTIDLLWTLNLPYKFTFGANILICIVCATFASLFEAPARYMWFSLGSVIFGGTWYTIVTLVRMRLEQFYSSHEFALGIPRATKSMLRTALFAYFSLWCMYPVLWILLEIGLISEVLQHCLHVLLDCSAKSAYGFAMLRFQLSSERNEFLLDPLRNSKTLKMETVAAVAAASSKLGPMDMQSDNNEIYLPVKPTSSVGGAPTSNNSRPASPVMGMRARSSHRLSITSYNNSTSAGGAGPLLANSFSRRTGTVGAVDDHHGDDLIHPGPPPLGGGGAESPRTRRLSIRRGVVPPLSPARDRRRSTENAMGMGNASVDDSPSGAGVQQQIQTLNAQLSRLLQQQQQQQGHHSSPGHSSTGRGGGGGGGGYGGMDDDDSSVGGAGGGDGANLRWTRPSWENLGAGGDPR